MNRPPTISPEDMELLKKCSTPLSVLLTAANNQGSLAETLKAIYKHLNQPTGGKRIPDFIFYSAAAQVVDRNSSRTILPSGPILFERFRSYPDYLLGGAELAIIKQQSGHFKAPITNSILIDIGTGNGTKIRDTLEKVGIPAACVLVDQSAESLLAAKQTLKERFPNLLVVTILANVFSLQFANHILWQRLKGIGAPTITTLFGGTPNNYGKNARISLYRTIRYCLNYIPLDNSTHRIWVTNDSTMDEATLRRAYANTFAEEFLRRGIEFCFYTARLNIDLQKLKFDVTIRDTRDGKEVVSNFINTQRQKITSKHGRRPIILEKGEPVGTLTSGKIPRTTAEKEYKAAGLIIGRRLPFVDPDPGRESDIALYLLEHTGKCRHLSRPNPRA